MVTINFKLSRLGTKTVAIDTPLQLDEVLLICTGSPAAELGSYIAIRAGKVISGKDLVADNDVIDLFPAIAGG